MFPYRVWSYVVHSLSWEPLRMKLFFHTKPNCSWTCLKGRLKTIHTMTNLKQVQVRGCSTCFFGACHPHPLGVQVYRNKLQRLLSFAAAWLEWATWKQKQQYMSQNQVVLVKILKKKEEKKSLYCKSDCVEVMLGICSNHNQILIHFLHKWLKTPSSLLN